jgi:hypothetical protein
MQWAVEHDYRLCHELTDAMKRQRKVLRLALKKEQRRSVDAGCLGAEAEEEAAVEHRSTSPAAAAARVRALYMPKEGAGVEEKVRSLAA